jgi:succinate dehydrogenase / fumarate reductase cytochrome b subunit
MYRSTGFVSFILRRVTGVALVLYLFLHMWVIGSINESPAAFDVRLALVQTPFFKFAEVLLLAAVVYHGIDGIRLLLVHYFNMTEYRKSLLYAVLVVSGLLIIAGGLPIVMFALEG